jgi:hypothetical protein
MAAEADRALGAEAPVDSAKLPYTPQLSRWRRPLTRRGRWALIIGVAAAVIVAGGGYIVYYEYYAPPFHNLAWQVKNPGYNVLDEVIGGSLYVVNVLEGNLSGNSTVLLRSISINSGDVGWQVTTTALYFIPIPGQFAVAVVADTVVFAYYQELTWRLIVDLFNGTTGAPSGNASLRVNLANDVTVRAAGTNLYFSGIEGSSTSPPNENLTLVTDAYTVENGQVMTAWNVTTSLAPTTSFGTSSYGFLLDPGYAVGWAYQWDRVVATNLTTDVTRNFANNPFEAPYGILVGDDLYDLQPSSNSWEVGQFNLTSGTNRTVFALPASAISNSSGAALYRQGTEFLVGKLCGFIGFDQCGGSLSAFSDSGSPLWQVSIGGATNPASTGYSVFFPTDQTVLFVGTPSFLPGPDGSSLTCQTTFVLVSLDSGNVLDRVTYGYSLTLPGPSQGFGSAPAVLSVYTAADDRVFYSYGSTLAASMV